MRTKIFSFLSLLLIFGATAWAQTSYRPTNRVTSLEAGKKYMIYNTCYNNAENRTGFIYSTGSGLAKTQTKPSLMMTSDAHYFWEVTPNGLENGYALKNVSTEKYHGVRGASNASDPKNLYIYPWNTLPGKQGGANAEIASAEGTYTAASSITFENDKVWLIGGTTDATVWWNGNPGDFVTWTNGQPFAFYEIEEAAAPITAFPEIADYSQATVYTISTPNRGSMYCDDAVADYLCATTRKGTTFDPTNPNFHFAFITSANGNTYFYNVGAQKFIYDGGNYPQLSNTPNANGVTTLLASTNATYQASYPTVIKLTDQLNVSTNQANGVLANWNDTGDLGNIVAIMPVEGTVDLSAVKAAVDAFENNYSTEYTITYNGVPGGQSALLSYNGIASANNAITGPEVFDMSKFSCTEISGYQYRITVNAQVITVTYMKRSITAIPTIADYSQATVYTINTYDRGSMYYNTEDAGFISSSGKTGATFDETNPYFQFAFITSEDGNTYLYNVGAHQFVTDGGTYAVTSDAPATNGVTFLTSTNTTYKDYFPVVIKLQDQICISNSWTHGVLANWNDTGDIGNTVSIRPVDATVDLAAVKEAIEAFEHPSYVTYDVTVYGIPGNTNAGVIYNGTTYSNGQQIENATSVITEENIVMANVAGYTAVVRTCTNEGSTGSIAIQYYYNIAGKTRLNTTDEIASTKGYIINNVGGRGVWRAIADGKITMANMVNIDSRGNSVSYFNAFNPTSKNDVWQFLKSGDDTYLYNPGTEKFVTFNGSVYALTSTKTPIYVTAHTNDGTPAGHFAMNCTDANYRFACAATQFADAPVRWWYDEGTDTQWEIVESDFSILPTTRAYNFAVVGLDECTDYDSSDDFMFNGEGFQPGDTYEASILLEASDITTNMTFTGYQLESITLVDGVITFTYSNAADLTALNEAKTAVLPYYNLIGNGVGHYSDPDNALTNAMATANAFLEAAKVTNDQQADIDAATQALTDAKDALVINTPASGYYRLKGTASSHYLTSPAEGADISSTSTETNSSNIFFLTEGNELVAYNRGLYLTSNTSNFASITLADVDAEHLNVTFGKSTTMPGAYTVQRNNDGTNLYFYDWTSYDPTHTLVNTEAVHNRCQWTIEPVEELPITLAEVNGEHVTTFFAGVNTTISGATAYTVALNGYNMTLTEITEGTVIPANTGIILKGDGTSATATITTEAGTASSVLTGSVSTISRDINETQYVFSLRNDVLGFFRYVGQTLAGGKAYYEVSTNNDVKVFVINFDTATGILNTSAADNTSCMYDLSGRHVVAPTKGLYIKNGKTYIVK